MGEPPVHAYVGPPPVAPVPLPPVPPAPVPPELLPPESLPPESLPPELLPPELLPPEPFAGALVKLPSIEQTRRLFEHVPENACPLTLALQLPSSDE
jgi:hypothetical protein